MGQTLHKSSNSRLGIYEALLAINSSRNFLQHNLLPHGPAYPPLDHYHQARGSTLVQWRLQEACLEQHQAYLKMMAPSEIKKQFKTLDTAKATGSDNILAIVLKTSAAELAAPLAKLFQYSYNTGIYPAMWK
eukprot:g22249.t1